MFLLESNVVFTRMNKGVEESSYTFKSVHEIEITKSVDELGDTAVIKLPTRFKIKQNGKETGGQMFVEKALQVGDKVKITLGYEGKSSKVEFVGYIKKISPKTPLEIHCEDAMWLLRRKNISESWKEKVDLKTVLQEIVKGTDIKVSDSVADFKLDKWMISENGAQALERLKKDFGFTAFITDEGTLYCGLQQLTNINQSASYDLNYNLVENNLEYKTKEGQEFNVKFTYIDPKTNIPIVGQAGDEGGEQRTYRTSTVSNKEELDKLAKAELEKLQFFGYTGDITSFLIPYATRGMKAILLDKEYVDSYGHFFREGSYFINKVVTTFGMNGARRKVSIRNKI